MPTWFDHALFVILALVAPIWGAGFSMRRLRRAAPGDVPRVRGSVYRLAMIVQWSLALAVLGLWIATGRPWSGLGLVPRATWGLGGIALGLVIVVIFALRQRRQILTDDESLADVRSKLAHVERLMPHTPSEMRAFYVLSVTAGVCEELLYRGFLIAYLVNWLGLFQAAGISAVIFGLGHLYQGGRGVLTTGAVGAFMAGVYLLTGSLFASMVFHALMDVHSGNLAFHAYERARLDAEARAAAPPDEPEWGAGAEAAEPWIEAFEDVSASPDRVAPAEDGDAGRA